jgi:hypothetical protein
MAFVAACHGSPLGGHRSYNGGFKNEANYRSEPGDKDRAEFLFIYIREAHPDSILRVSDGQKLALTKIAQTNNLTQRAQVAQQCTQTLMLSLPTLIDGPDNRTSAAYAGWPNRLVVVGRDGTVAYKEPPGANFQPAAVEKWLQANLPPSP